MPTATPRFCSCGRYVVKAGGVCPCAKQRKRAMDAARPSPRTMGYDKDWEKARAAWLALHPLCVECGEKATHVDHIVSIRKAPERRLDPTNYQSMCRSCHSKKTARVDGSFGRPS